MEQELFKAIFKIEGDSTSAIKALDDVNKKYEESTDLLNDQKRLLKELTEKEKQLLEGRAKANNPTQAARYNNELTETAKKINALKANIEQTSQATGKLKKESDSLTTSLRQAFDGTRINAAKTQVEDFNKSTKSLRSQLKDLKQQLAATNDDEEFVRLSVQAGELQDKIDDAAQAAKAFATGSPLQAFGNSLRGVASDLLNLDFEGAAQKSQLLAEASKRITFKGGLEGIKQLGTTLANTGKALLTNPIFLIGAAVTLIITNFDKLKNSGGLIGKTFTFLSDTVTTLKNGFLALTDAIGLTDTATSNYNDRIAEDFNRNLNNQIDNTERLIKVMRALGQETAALEIQAVRQRMRPAELQLKALQKAVDDIEARNKKLPAGVQQILIPSDLQAAYDSAKKIVDDGEAEIAVIKAGWNNRINEKRIKDNEAAINKELEDRRKQREFEEGGEADLLRIQAEQREQAEKDELDRRQNFERTKQEIDLTNSAQSVDIAKAEAEEKEKIDKELWDKKMALMQQELDGINTVTSAAINGAQSVLTAQQRQTDQLINLQSKRVEETKAIADKGNAELLELEQKRLDDLNQKRERFVRQQQALALIELTANSTIAIAKAAAQGGVAAPFTIAATLLALGAGFIQARSLAASQGFYKGGYTGEGDPHAESTVLGRKPYTYHKGEFVFNHEKTRKYKDIFDGIHKGNIDLSEWRHKVEAFESMRYIAPAVNIDVEGLQSEIRTLKRTIENQSTSLSFDEHGLNARFQNIKVRQEWIKNHLAK